MQRLGGLSYFGGAEKKDDHILVPDLGSLTSTHDRCANIDQFYFFLDRFSFKEQSFFI